MVKPLGGVGAALSTLAGRTCHSQRSVHARSYPDQFIGHGPSEALQAQFRRKG